MSNWFAKSVYDYMCDRRDVTWSTSHLMFWTDAIALLYFFFFLQKKASTSWRCWFPATLQALLLAREARPLCSYRKRQVPPSSCPNPKTSTQVSLPNVSVHHQYTFKSYTFSPILASTQIVSKHTIITLLAIVFVVCINVVLTKAYNVAFSRGTKLHPQWKSYEKDVIFGMWPPHMAFIESQVAQRGRSSQARMQIVVKKESKLGECRLRSFISETLVHWVV